MKFEHILFPVDFSDESRAMNTDVEWLATHFNSRVTLLNVFEIPTNWYGGGDAPLLTGAEFTAYADAAKQSLAAYPLQLPQDRVERLLLEGSAAWQIARVTEQRKMGLIVMGTHGYGPLRRFLLGSVAMKVLHDVKCPVWTHPAQAGSEPQRRAGISRILCSVELSPETVPLLRITKELAADFGASVQLIHCVPETEPRPSGYYDDDLHRSLKGWVDQEVYRLQEEADTDFPLIVTERFIAQDVAEQARLNSADLVIIGRGKVQGVFGTLRTHAYDIIRAVPCPVLSFCLEHTHPKSSREESHAPAARLTPNV